MKQGSEAQGPAPMTCSFCQKTQHEVAVLIAGPNVTICDECVELCDEIIASRGGERAAQLNVRAATLTVCAKWEPPTPDEVRAVLSAAGLTKAAAARLIGVSDSRAVGRWLAPGDESSIPYAHWALLCQAAGLGLIWGLVRPVPARD